MKAIEIYDHVEANLTAAAGAGRTVTEFACALLIEGLKLVEEGRWRVAEVDAGGAETSESGMGANNEIEIVFSGESMAKLREIADRAGTDPDTAAQALFEEMAARCREDPEAFGRWLSSVMGTKAIRAETHCQSPPGTPDDEAGRERFGDAMKSRPNRRLR